MAQPRCGTRFAYRRGCRCADCREAQRVYMLEYQRRRAAARTEDERLERNQAHREWRANRRTERVAAGLPANEWDESRKAAYAKRRAARTATTVETIRPTDIYERDGWTCAICDDPVDSTLAYPDPLSASLDHEQPLSLGGAHIAENVRCSHLICNIRRGNRAA